ncbi:MAG: ribonuclease, partial [Verrucomicrobiales bacterium]|nr:ribonuclease [Verrucomicrobiales bacterium]
MIELGFEPDFSHGVEQQLAAFTSAPSKKASTEIADLRALLWSSIDNDDSRDLDQVEFAERLPDGGIRLFVAIADVDSKVLVGSAVDDHAKANTTSVYTGIATFPMLPEILSTDLTSLNEGKERLAIVTEMVVSIDGEIHFVGIKQALVVNQARLTYEEVGDWLEHRAERPFCCQRVQGLERQLELQFEAANRLAKFRKAAGALTFSTIEPKIIKRDGKIVDLAIARHNAARDIIESFMLATNISLANFLKQRNSPFIERVVREPKRWDRICEIAAGFGATLPTLPNPKALSEFLSARQAADPLHYPDLSLTIVKLLGPGEYALEKAGENEQGHFGLAVNDYTHSTAPNRRFADLVIQRLVKALLVSAPAPYGESDLGQIADHCTERENAARKVERQMRKIIAASSLAQRIGERFEGVITGSNEKGVYVRLLTWPAEGRVTRGEQGVDVGDKVQVKLIRVDIDKGFIDFERIS